MMIKACAELQTLFSEEPELVPIIFPNKPPLLFTSDFLLVFMLCYEAKKKSEQLMMIIFNNSSLSSLSLIQIFFLLTMNKLKT